MKLEEMPLSSPSQEIEAIFRQQGRDIPAVITQVTWELRMDVMVSGGYHPNHLGTAYGCYG